MPHEDSPLDLSFENVPRLSFPDDAWEWFSNACRDIELPLDDAKRPVLEALYSHLLFVNESLNLTRIVTPLPLMTWLPDRRWALVDSRPHKVEFLNETLKLTPAAQNAHGYAFRGREAAAQAPELFQSCQLVTARAVGKGVELLQDVTALLDINGIFILMKGPAWPETEQKDFLRALPSAGFDLVEEQNIALDESDPDRWVIITTKLRHPKQKSTASKGKFKASENGGR